MVILGLHSGFSNGIHDPSAVLIIDGKLVVACEEERFSRIKMSPNMLPVLSIRHCLTIANITIQDVDVIAHPGASFADYEERVRAYVKYYFNYCPKIMLVDHHTSHLASAFFASGYKNSTCLSYDGYGEDCSTALALGSLDGLKIFERYEKHNSLGLFYSAITSFLGFNAGSDEYKLMGLAAYGRSEQDLSDILQISDNEYKFNEKILRSDFAGLGWQEPIFSNQLVKLLGKPRQPSQEITQRHMDIAYSAQRQLERAVLNLTRHAMRVTGSYNLCLSGGVALNAAANGLLYSNPLVNRLFIQPASSDRGLSLGAAMYIAHNMGEKIINPTHMYLGEQYDTTSIEKALQQTNLSAKSIEKIGSFAAQKLAEGKIVAWFQGRSEFGPRALGNRSILAEPCYSATRQHINARIKYREEFRPFAPAVIEELASDLFSIEPGDSSPFMTINYRVKDTWIDKLQAVTHVNQTARVQTVNSIDNPSLFDLLTEFYGITGVPAVLNTSFNLQGQPIVETPLDAIGTFAMSGIDVLIMGNYAIEK